MLISKRIEHNPSSVVRNRRENTAVTQKRSKDRMVEKNKNITKTRKIYRSKKECEAKNKRIESSERAAKEDKIMLLR